MATWHAISRPRSHVRLSDDAFDIRTPQQGAKQFGFRLAPNDFDRNQFVHATTLRLVQPVSRLAQSGAPPQRAALAKRIGWRLESSTHEGGR
jgi:hypothetical protein